MSLKELNTSAAWSVIWACAGIIFFFVKFFDVKEKDQSLHARIWASLGIIGGLLLLSSSFGMPKFVGYFVEAGYTVFFLYFFRNYPLQRLPLIAAAPLLVFSFISYSILLMSKSYFLSIKDGLESVVGFSTAWAVGFAFYAFNYKKKEKQRMAKLEIENQIVTGKNKELEKLVDVRTKEILNQKNELEITLESLKSTQNKLIQQEKLASLGELTAGIAHEIQNPLNFVMNFSELNVELIDEINEEIAKDKADLVLIKELLGDLNQNQEKINHHGKRASSIVKGMLQHSRAQSGQKEPIDINLLADEYLRLSYHGIRAKDKGFNAEFEIKVDDTIPKIEGMAQDIGRVFLNLINNAFYAVYKRKQTDDSFKPKVVLTTQLSDHKIVVKIADNGIGIPAELKDKIFQPFFTTKPTGEGTGLGLSLAYDIIVKGHKGTMDVESKLNEGTEFTVTLPIK